MKSGKEKKVREPGTLTGGKFFAWVARDMSRNIQTVAMGALTVYGTSALHMNAALLGTLLMGTKIFDGFTDLIAGYFVDNTKTKWGKGRPYEFFMLGLWFFTWLCFSVPEQASTVVKCIWIVLAYSLAQSVCYTFLNTNGTAYMVRAFKKESDYVKLSSLGGLVAIVGVIVFNIVFPILEAKIMYNASGWSKLFAALAIPLTIIGMLRFFFVKEEVDVDSVVQGEGQERVTIKDMLTVLKANKYIWIVALVLLASNLFTSLGATTYLCIVTFGDTSMASVLSFFSIVPMLTMALYPKILKKLSVKQLIMVSLLLTIPACPLFYIAGTSIPLLAIAAILSNMALMPLSMMSSLLIVECAMYNEYRGLQRMEGTLNSITGFFTKIGQALASFVAGILLSISGYVGTLGVNEAASAKSMILFMSGGLPVVMTIILIIALRFYTLDKHKAEYEAVIEERRAAAENK